MRGGVFPIVAAFFCSLSPQPFSAALAKGPNAPSLKHVGDTETDVTGAAKRDGHRFFGVAFTELAIGLAFQNCDAINLRIDNQVTANAPFFVTGAFEF